jgi:hypothetical protein
VCEFRDGTRNISISARQAQRGSKPGESIHLRPWSQRKVGVPIIHVCAVLTSYLIRKTGVTIPDTGVRDEEGFEPMDDLFSPEKPESVRPDKSTNGKRRNATEDETISSEADMEMDESMLTVAKLVASGRPY